MFDDAGVGNLPLGIVHHGAALVILAVENLRLKADRAVFKMPQPIAEILVHAPGIDRDRGNARVRLDKGRVVCLEEYVAAIEKLFRNGVVALLGDALVPVEEIVVVIGKPQRQPPDDERRKLRAGAAPLLFGIPLHELFIHIPAYKLQRLLLKVLRLTDVQRLDLLPDDPLRLLRRADIPHFGKCVHVEGEVVQLVLIDRHRGIDKAVKFRKTVYIIPNLFV